MDTKHWFWVWLHLITLPKKTAQGTLAKGELWQNLVLVSAETVQLAVKRALELGKAEEGDSRGTLTLDGRPAVTMFLGIGDMGLVHEPLQDGVEILFRSSRKTLQSAKEGIPPLDILIERINTEVAPYQSRSSS
jgi:hypothetical protein